MKTGYKEFETGIWFKFFNFYYSDFWTFVGTGNTRKNETKSKQKRIVHLTFLFLDDTRTTVYTSWTSQQYHLSRRYLRCFGEVKHHAPLPAFKLIVCYPLTTPVVE